MVRALLGGQSPISAEPLHSAFLRVRLRGLLSTPFRTHRPAGGRISGEAWGGGGRLQLKRTAAFQPTEGAAAPS